jgi:hypothetical protein
MNMMYAVQAARIVRTAGRELLTDILRQLGPLLRMIVSSSLKIYKIIEGEEIGDGKGKVGLRFNSRVGRYSARSRAALSPARSKALTLLYSILFNRLILGHAESLLRPINTAKDIAAMCLSPVLQCHWQD